MDPVSAVASIVGIVGFGIQIAQILQKEIDAIQTATERVEQIVIEIRATATGLTNLQDFLLQDHEVSLDDRIFNDEGRTEVTHIVRRCNTVFRNITVLVAKSGNGILSSVDQFQRKLEQEHKKDKGAGESSIKLEIELSNLEHLMWPWRLPKIEQYIADLDRLKLSLVLILSVANLAKTKKQKKIKDNDANSEQWDGSQADTLVQDEIFYQDRGLQEAEKKYKIITVGVSPNEGVARSTNGAAQVLISNWPDAPSGRGISSITELHESGIVLEGFVINSDDIEQRVIEIPLNMRSMQDHALKRRRWGSRKPLSVWDAFARLPEYQQEILLTFIAQRKRELYDYSRDSSPLSPQLVLISLNVAKHRWRRFLGVLKGFITFGDENTQTRSTLFFVTARVGESHRNGPEALISSTIPGGTLFNGVGPRREDADDSESTSSGHRSSSPSRSRRRSRVRYSRSRSRSRTRGNRRVLVVSAARGLKAAYKNRRARRLAEERRSRSRSRRRRYSPDSGYDEVYYYRRGGESQVRAARASGADQSTARYNDATAPTVNSSQISRTRLPKPGDPGFDEIRLRRVTTLDETDGDEPSAFPPPPPRREQTVIQSDQLEPYLPPPPPQRTTTFQEGEHRGGKLVGGQALASLGLGSLFHKEQSASRGTENKTAGRNTAARSSRDLRVTRGERSRRDRSRSRSRSRVIAPMRTTWRGRSNSGERRSRRSKRGETIIQMVRKSPERPVIRTYTDDGVPPTQRDKTAVAEYYLKKWTTAYDHVRARNRETRNVTRGASRSRRRSRNGDVPDAGLIEYGDAPVYGNQTGYYPPDPYPPDPYYSDANPYQGAYNPADYGYAGYHPSGTQTTGANAADTSGAPEQKSSAEKETERRENSSASESDNGRRRRHSRNEDDNGSADEEAETRRLSPPPSDTHTVSLAGLVVPSAQRAYAESVPDTGNEKDEFV